MFLSSRHSNFLNSYSSYHTSEYVMDFARRFHAIYRFSREAMFFKVGIGYLVSLISAYMVLGVVFESVRNLPFEYGAFQVLQHFVI